MAAVVPLEREGPPALKIVSGFRLLQNFRPIETIVDGLPLPRGGVATLTAPSGHGKTTVTAALEVALVRGIPFAGREVTQGSVLVLAGENPDDYTMHLAATMQDLGLYPAELNRPAPAGELLVVPGTFAIDYELDNLKDMLSVQTLVAVVVDTSAAFFGADDENDNVAMRRHASMLRTLTELPGRPCVIVNAHPTKTAARDNLLPRGGGAFLAEVDANLTMWKDDAGLLTMHWAGKIRGPSFDPIKFELVPLELEGFRDCRDRPIFSVAARHIPEERAEQLQAKEIDDQDVMLVSLLRKPGASVRDLAQQCGWTNGMGKPLHARADRQLKGLAKQGLVEQDRKGTWRLTPKGTKEADRL